MTSFSTSTFFQSTLQELQVWLERERLRRQVPGWAVSLCTPEHEIWLAGSGEARAGQAVSPETPFQIGSITKVFTACVILRLRDEGHFHLDQAIADVLPEFQPSIPFVATRPPTFRQVLSHTAGLPYHFDTSGWTAENLPSPDELLEQLSSLSLIYPPLTRFKYSNVGSFVLGEVVRRIRGKSIAEVIEEELLKPLGMSQSGFFLSGHSELGSQLAVGHVLDEEGKAHPLPHYEAPTFAAASELYTSVQDLTRFLQWQCHEGPVDDQHPLCVSTLREMHAPVFLSESGHEGTALGWRMGRVAGHQEIHHGGGMPGLLSFVRVLPRLGLGVALLANTNTDPETLTRELLERFVPVWEERLDQEEWLGAGLEEKDWEELLGEYEVPGFRKYVFEQRGFRLLATVPGSPESEWFRLRPLGGDRYRMEGGPSDGEETRFLRDEAGLILSLQSSSHHFWKK